MNVTNSKNCLSGLAEEELILLAKNSNWPPFKGKQIHSWIYKKWASNFDEMTDLSIKERKFLNDNYILSPIKLIDKQVSKDATIKYLWKTHDNQLIESVRMYMDEQDSYSACISSQAGCAVGCQFCATGKLGLKRNLTASEIIDQLLAIQRDTKERLSNVVFMGQGEPLQNFNNVVKAIRIIINSVSIGARHITLSTSGIPPNIKKLAHEKLQITLAVSLHAPDQQTREKLVPISKRYKMEELIENLHYYYSQTKRRITIEYVLLEGINDAIEKAKALADLIKDLHCHINLIPYNPIQNPQSKIQNLKRPPLQKIIKFKEVLEKTSHKKVTIRHERGIDINAACGQLANLYQN